MTNQKEPTKVVNLSDRWELRDKKHAQQNLAAIAERLAILEPVSELLVGIEALGQTPDERTEFKRTAYGVQSIIHRLRSYERALRL